MAARASRIMPQTSTTSNWSSFRVSQRVSERDQNQARQRLLGGGPSARFWHAIGGPPLPDALTTLTLLLVILSQSDQRFSEVLDREGCTGA